MVTPKEKVQPAPQAVGGNRWLRDIA